MKTFLVLSVLALSVLCSEAFLTSLLGGGSSSSSAGASSTSSFAPSESFSGEGGGSAGLGSLLAIPQQLIEAKKNKLQKFLRSIQGGIGGSGSHSGAHSGSFSGSGSNSNGGGYSYSRPSQDASFSTGQSQSYQQAPIQSYPSQPQQNFQSLPQQNFQSQPQPVIVQVYKIQVPNEQESYSQAQSQSFAPQRPSADYHQESRPIYQEPSRPVYQEQPRPVYQEPSRPVYQEQPRPVYQPSRPVYQEQQPVYEQPIVPHQHHESCGHGQSQGYAYQQQDRPTALIQPIEPYRPNYQSQSQSSASSQGSGYNIEQAQMIELPAQSYNEISSPSNSYLPPSNY